MDFPRGGSPYFYDPKGWPLPDAPPPVRLPRAPTRALERENRLRGIEPDFWTCKNGNKREDDVPGEVILRAFDALEGTAPGQPGWERTALDAPGWEGTALEQP